MITRATDLQNLLALVRQDPGRPANHYAARLNLPHNDVRKLLVELEQQGELDSKRVRVYRAALQRPGEREQCQGHPHDDQPHVHPAVWRHHSGDGKAGRQGHQVNSEVHPTPRIARRNDVDAHKCGDQDHGRQQPQPLALPVGKTHPHRHITDDQGAHAETPEGTQ